VAPGAGLSDTGSGLYWCSRGHSSAGRAPALQAGGHRFDPGWLHRRPICRYFLVVECLRMALQLAPAAEPNILFCRASAFSATCCLESTDITADRCVRRNVRRGLPVRSSRDASRHRHGRGTYTRGDPGRGDTKRAGCVRARPLRCGCARGGGSPRGRLGCVTHRGLACTAGHQSRMHRIRRCVQRCGTRPSLG
jgi:hypothetical protein